MELTVGAILDGKVKSITNFGAFIALPENKTGLVHISEVANTYVSDVREHLTEGQDVKVMVLSAEAGKVNLSIKRLEAKPQREERAPRKEAAPRPARTAPTPPPAPNTLSCHSPFQPLLPITALSWIPWTDTLRTPRGLGAPGSAHWSQGRCSNR